MPFSGPDDYNIISMSEVVTFDPQPDGQSAPQCINIQITNDNILEAEEMFLVGIQSTNPNVSPDPSANSTTVVIMNDDGMRNSRIFFEENYAQYFFRRR